MTRRRRRLVVAALSGAFVGGFMGVIGWPLWLSCLVCGLIGAVLW